MQDWEKNLKERGPERIKKFLSFKSAQSDSDKLGSEYIIFNSPCDLGVIRNGGKRGAKHGPAALMAPFQGMVAPKGLNDLKGPLSVLTETPPSQNPQDFDEVQGHELSSFQKLFKENANDIKKLCHIGGGHDHAYPLGAAMQQIVGPVVILNIDAHLDTRPDDLHHSGTPFRQLLKEGGKKMTLIQLGIHNFANGKSNYKDLEQMEVLPWSPETSAKEMREQITEALTPHKEATLFLSIDCDGLDASFMPAVSAPNHLGLNQRQFHGVLEACSEFWAQSSKPQVLGLYEFNPLFDNLSQAAARYMAQVMYRFFFGVKEKHE